MVSSRTTPNADQVPVNIVGGSQFGRYSKISAERTVNMFVTTAGTPDADDYEAWLVNFMGYRRVLNFTKFPDPVPVAYPNKLPAGIGRGLFHSIRGNLAVAIINSVVYKIIPNLGVTVVGNIASTTGDVYMAENLNSQICIVDGVNAYIYNYSGSGSLTVQSLSGTLVPNYVKYHNTFFLFGNGNTTADGAAWYAYSYATPTTITQTSQLALQTKADYAKAVQPIPGRGNNVLVFGTTVCEVHTQVGGLQNYIRQPSVNINYGCLSIATIAEGGNYIAWLGANEDESPVIMVYDGNEAVTISTDGIDYLMSTIKFPETSTGFLYREDGHLFYQLTFYNKADNLTLVYDFNTRLFSNLTDQYNNYHPARQVMYFNLKTYFISLNNAALYELSSNITIIDENLPRLNASIVYNPNLVFEIPRIRITSGIRKPGSPRFIANGLSLTLEQGTDPRFTELDTVKVVGQYLITEATNIPALDNIITEGGQQMIVENPADADFSFNPDYSYSYPLYDFIFYQPRIELALSKDGGITWSSDVERTLMPLGHRQNILQWEGMGAANDLCFRFRFWGTYRFIVNNATCDVIS